MTDTAPALAWLDAHEARSIERLMDWLRIPSVSTDPAYREETRRAAEWAADHLRESGLEVEILETGTDEAPGHPIVVAEANLAGSKPGDPEASGPHVLFYGHYDVQPADPLELWRTGPFEPTLEGEGDSQRIVARGACDDKGQVASFLEALRAWKETGGPVAGGMRVTVLLEGEEESGSVNLERFVEQHAERLGKCDVCLISDTGMLGPGRPAITYGVRGLSYTEVVLHGPDQDLHSGAWGGRVPNPISELTKVLAQLWDSDRRVMIPGFYDSVRPLGEAERAEWNRVVPAPTDSLRGIGLGPDADVGEAGFTAVEREWGRPTAELNGIIGGYTGAGAKTVIPTHASAKISFRLVADQEPEKIRDAFFGWLNERTPRGCRWELIDHGGGWPATVSTESAPLAVVKAALARAAGAEPAMIKTGGSIPVAGLLKQRLGIETIFMGFGLEDDRVHSPNEKFDLACFRMGCRAHVEAMSALAEG
ncbi:MAG: M20/M25/M40 family metallo-hydrolase [Planctomycetota bacterium]